MSMISLPLDYKLPKDTGGILFIISSSHLASSLEPSGHWMRHVLNEQIHMQRHKMMVSGLRDEPCRYDLVLPWSKLQKPKMRNLFLPLGIRAGQTKVSQKTTSQELATSLPKENSFLPPISKLRIQGSPKLLLWTQEMALHHLITT